MPTCYFCGRKIEEGKGVRKEVYTGHSRTAGISGRRPWFGGRENYSMRLVCEDCAKPTLFEAISALIKLAVFIVIVSFFYNVCTPGCGNSHKNSVVPEKMVEPSNILPLKEDSVKLKKPVKYKKTIRHKMKYKKQIKDTI